MKLHGHPPHRSWSYRATSHPSLHAVFPNHALRKEYNMLLAAYCGCNHIVHKKKACRITHIHRHIRIILVGHTSTTSIVLRIFFDRDRGPNWSPDSEGVLDMVTSSITMFGDDCVCYLVRRWKIIFIPHNLMRWP